MEPRFYITDPNELYKYCYEMRLRNDSAVWYQDDIMLPPVECADGWQVSIQAGTTYYSIPRMAGYDDYQAFELGYPSEREPLLDKYVDWWGEEEPDYTKAVYPFVPTELIIDILENHGGIVKYAENWGKNQEDSE